VPYNFPLIAGAAGAAKRRGWKHMDH